MRRLIPPLAVSVPITIFSIAALALPLAAGEDLGQSERELSAWLLILYALPGLLSLALTFLLRIPLLLAWHTSLIVYFATLADEFTEAEIRGGIFVAGALMVLLGSTGMAGRIANLVPAPVVFAVVAGTVLPFVTRTFTELGNERLMIAAVLLAWLASRKVMGATFPAILPALIAGVTVAAARDEFGSAPANWEFPGIDPTAPAFSFAAIMTVVPVFVALASFHANLTAVTYLRSQGYAPPARLIEVVTGCGSVVGSLFGPIPVNMGALVTPLTAGPEAGERDVRVWSVYFSSGAFLLIGLAGIFAARLPQVMPLGLLLAVAGLALVPVLAQALAEMSRGPVQLGPVLTFAVTVSGVSIFDLGSPFWGIVIGSATALLLDREQAVSPTATARPQPVTVDGS